MNTSNRKENQLISFLLFRTFIGAIGIALPIILVIANSFYVGSFDIQDSISDYYQTRVRDLFVGILFILGIFLLSYRGYARMDNIISSLGCFFALGVALFPNQNPLVSVQIIHFASAGLMFSVFIYFSLWLFRKGKAKVDRSPQKNRRNRIYLICGILMAIFILCIGLSFIIFNEEQRSACKLIFVFETLALWTFGISWLTKGKVMWQFFRLHYIQKPI